jgi:antitoxin HigA-1
MTKKIPLPNPGEMLRKEFLEPLSLTAGQLAKQLRIPRAQISAILCGDRAITVRMGLRLDRYFTLSDGWWFRLQADCDRRRAKKRSVRNARARPIAYR